MLYDLKSLFLETSDHIKILHYLSIKDDVIIRSSVYLVPTVLNHRSKPQKWNKTNPNRTQIGTTRKIKPTHPHVEAVRQVELSAHIANLLVLCRASLQLPSTKEKL